MKDHQMDHQWRKERRASSRVARWAPEERRAFGGSSVLVTGGTGFVGRHLCGLLNDLGANVHVVTRDGTVPPGCTPVHVDVRDAKALLAALDRVSPARIFHLAATVDARRNSELVKPTLEGNLVGTVNLLAAAHAVGCERIVTTASSEESSDPSEPPTSPYAASKTAARAYARMYHALYGVPIVIARPFMCYGPGQASNKVIPYTILSFLRGDSPVLSSGKRVCDFVYVDDVARGLVMCALAAGVEGQTIDLGTGQPNTIHDVVNKIATILGAGGRLTFGGRPDRVLETDQVAFRSDGTRLTRWSPKWSLDDGLHMTVAWYRARVATSSDMHAFSTALTATDGGRR